MMTNNPPPPSKGSINSSRSSIPARGNRTAPAAGDAKAKKQKRERGVHGGVEVGDGACAKTN